MAGKLTMPEFRALSNAMIGRVVRHASFELWTDLTAINPVDSGRSRANWHATINYKDATNVPPGAYGPPTPPVLGRVEPWDTVWLVNNLPYIIPLNEGHSMQAPPGWIDAAVLRVKTKATKIINAARSELSSQGGLS